MNQYFLRVICKNCTYHQYCAMVTKPVSVPVLVFSFSQYRTCFCCCCTHVALELVPRTTATTATTSLSLLLLLLLFLTLCLFMIYVVLCFYFICFQMKIALKTNGTLFLIEVVVVVDFGALLNAYYFFCFLKKIN